MELEEKILLASPLEFYPFSHPLMDTHHVPGLMDNGIAWEQHEELLE